MLQSTGSERVRHDLATEPQHYGGLKFEEFYFLVNFGQNYPHCPYMLIPWHLLGVGSRYLPKISKSADAQVPYIKYCNICI